MEHSAAIDRDVEGLIAASLLRWGTDTKALRLFKELGLGNRDGPPPALRLAEVLGTTMDDAVNRARLAAKHAVERGIVPICAGTPGYPSRLSEIADPPIVLWVMGEAGALTQPAVALVGSRRATPGGLTLAHRLARDLARAGLAVVSGLARGVDAAAHRGAIDGGGLTIAVLGAGVDVVYPREHADLARRIRTSGCLVSELPPDTPPLPRHFPLRNRLISGLSLAVVVVEAAERSGSLITARMALEQGRDVLAVPGSVVSGCHRGCHALIKDGAGLVETADDVLAALGWSAPSSAPAVADQTGLARAMKAGEPVGVDELAHRVGRPVVEVLAELGELEVAGQVIRVAGGLFARVD